MAKQTKKGNNVAEKAAAGTLIIVVLSIVILFMADKVVSFKDVNTRYEFKELVDNYMMFGNIITLSMLLLSVYLIFIYLKDYLELKSSFTLGVLLAVISFMLFAVTSNPMFHQFLGIYGKTGVFMLVPYIFATISLAILAWISSK